MTTGGEAASRPAEVLRVLVGVSVLAEGTRFKGVVDEIVDGLVGGLVGVNSMSFVIPFNIFNRPSKSESTFFIPNRYDNRLSSGPLLLGEITRGPRLELRDPRNDNRGSSSCFGAAAVALIEAAAVALTEAVAELKISSIEF